MKRKKAARRKLDQKPTAARSKPISVPSGNDCRLPPFWSFEAEDSPRYTPSTGTPYWTTGTRIRGVEVPANLDKAIGSHGEQTYLDIQEVWEFEPWRFFDHFPANNDCRYTQRFLGGDPQDFASWEFCDLGDPASWKKTKRGDWSGLVEFSYPEMMILHAAINTAMAQGFFLALLRYADELKHVPEAAALIEKEEARKEIARVNGKVRAERAAPLRRDIEKRFRQLRKTEPKRGRESLYRQIAKEVGRSVRHVQRIVNDADID